MTTDAAGNRIYLPAVPHAVNVPPKLDANMDGKVDGSAATLGGDDGHYSPRFVPNGAANKVGVNLGLCVYPCGRNTWTLCFVDVDMDCVPDRFTNSTWESKDGGVRVGDWAFSGRITTFTTDLSKEKVVARPIRLDVSGPRNRTTDEDGAPENDC